MSVEVLALTTPGADEPLPPEHARSLDAIFQQEASYVWNVLRRMGVAERDLEDMLHELFLRVHRELHRYDQARPIRPWLFGFAFRLVSEQRRMARQRVFVPFEDPMAVDTAPPADDALIGLQDRQLVERALGRVELNRRAVLMLHEIEGCSIPQIAEALGIPLNTAYSRLRIARAEFVKAVHRLQGRTP